MIGYILGLGCFSIHRTVEGRCGMDITRKERGAEIPPEAQPEKDFDRETGLLELAAEGSGPPALSAAEQLAGMYEEGIGTGADYAKALRWRKRAVGLSEHLQGKEHPETATTYNNIAEVYDKQGDYPQALEWYYKGLAVSEQALGIDNPETALTYSIIAGIYADQGDYPQTLKWYYRVLAIMEKALGEEHPYTVSICNTIAFFCDKEGDYPQALKWYYRVLAIMEKALGEEHPYTVSICNTIAFFCDKEGDYPLALEWHQKVLAIREKHWEKNTPTQSQHTTASQDSAVTEKKQWNKHLIQTMPQAI
jgi:tetratricopeptide (TPR) repeat protein